MTLFNYLIKYYKKTYHYLTNHENISALIFFSLLILLFFAPVVFNGKTLTTSVFSGGVMPSGPYKYDGTHPPMFTVRDPGAFNWVDEPLSEYTSNVIKNEHRIPLWNPNMGAGYPILGGIQLGTFFPLNWIVFLFSSESAWDIIILLRILFAGFFTYLFARKIKLNQKPAILAGVVFMFSGYSMNFLNMAHFSTEFLIPLLFLSIETFLQKINVKNFIFISLATALLILPGMPEATAFAFALGILWFVFSLIFLHNEIARKIKTAILFIFAFILGIIVCSAQLIPFTELLKLSFNSHSDSLVGLHSIPFDTIISMFYPFIFNPVNNWIAAFYYLGIASILLVFLTITSLKQFEKKDKLIIYFFVIFSTLGLMKVYGNPLINWIGSLPILNVLIFPKYSAPAIIFSLSILSAYGYFLVSEKRIKYITSKIILLLILILALTVFSIKSKMADFIPRIQETDAMAKNLLKFLFKQLNINPPSDFFNTIASSLTLPYMLVAIFAGIFLLLIFSIIIIKANSKHNFFKNLILFFIVFELFIYTLPLVRASRYETFREAPFVKFLKNDASVFRIYGQTSPTQNSMLFPNTSSVFGIQDVRFLMALADKRYFMFLKNVLGVSNEEISTIRFTGMYPLDLNSKFLDLLNVKYFLTLPDYTNNTIAENIIANNSSISNSQFVSLGNAKLKKRKLAGIILHAPSKIEFPYIANSNKLSFEYGIGDTGIKQSNGVRFIVSIKNNGKTKEILNDFIDPNDKKYVSWQKAELDLADYQKNEIVISMESQDNGNNVFDQFYVGNFSDNPDAIVYDDEVKIIENNDVIPRVFISHRVEKIEKAEDIFARLKDESFDIRKNIIIEESFPAEKLSNSPETDDSSAKIIHYKNEQIEIETNMENNGFLVLLDQYYPGWKVFVNEKEEKIYATDYIFRSVYLPKGKHKVKFIYDPQSYKTGKYISLATLILLTGLFIKRKALDQRLVK